MLTITLFTFFLWLTDLNSWERASISLLKLSFTQGNYWHHVCIVFDMTKPSPYALEAIPLLE